MGRDQWKVPVDDVTKVYKVGPLFRSMNDALTHTSASLSLL